VAILGLTELKKRIIKESYMYRFFIRLAAFSILMITISGALLSQDDQQKTHRHRDSQGAGTGKITGVVVDRKGNAPLQGVALIVFKQKDSTRVAGAETDAQGNYSIDVPFGMYKMEADYVGYNLVTVSRINVSDKTPTVALDTIHISQGSTMTEEIEVIAQKNVMEFTPEKKIFNVSETPVSQTGSAADVLNNVPSVTVDDQGNVSMRGSQNVKIMIDGKPITQDVSTLLDDIPASSIESVELITNPSARYEAEGDAGFINLVLKKSDEFGYNGTFSISGASRDKYNSSINLNLKNKKFNIYGNYNLGVTTYYNTGTNDRTYTSGSISLLDQPSSETGRNYTQLGKLGIDYNITDKQILSVSATMSYRKRNSNSNTPNSEFDVNNVLADQTNTNDIENRKGLNFIGDLTYNIKFKNPKETLSFEASYTRSSDNEDHNLTTGNYILNYQPANIPSGFQNTSLTGVEQNAFFQADYSHPFSKDTKLDAGVRSNYRENNDGYSSQHYNDTTNQWVYDASISNTFDYKEYIQAAYMIFASKINKFGYQVGLRTEYTHTNGNLLTTGQVFTNNYLDFFPSVNLTQELGTNELQLSYSRRLNRPRSNFLNPFINFEDPLNLSQGNPQIKPEYIDSYEFSYLKYLGKNVITSSIFFRETHGMITRFRTLLDSIRTLTTFENLSNARSYGIDLIGNFQITNFWNLTGNVSYYRTDIAAGNLQADLSNSGYSWSSKILTNVKLWAGLNISASYFYVSKRPIAQGFILPIQSMDVSIREDFAGGKASLAVRGGDIFNTREFKLNTSSFGYVQDLTRKRDSQNVYLTFTYRFGNLYDKGNQRQKKKIDDTNPDDNPDIEGQ